MRKTKAAAFITALVVAATAVFTACTPSNNATIININNGEEKLTYGYVNFVCKFNQAIYDQMYLNYAGKDYWSKRQDSTSPTFQSTTKSNIYSQIKHQYLAKKYAKSLGISVTADDEKAIKKAAKKFMTDNSEQAIKQVGATEEYVETLLEYQTYYSRVHDKLEDQADVTVSPSQYKQSSVSYVLFSTVSDSSASGDAKKKMSASDKAKLKAQAEKVAAASDFEAEAKAQKAEVQTYSFTTAEDPGTDPTLDEKVIQAAKKLSDGQVSDVISVSDKGYYVVRMDKTYDKDKSKTVRENLESEKKEDAFNDQMDKWEKKVTFKRDNKLWKQIQFTDLFTTPETSSGDATSSLGSN